MCTADTNKLHRRLHRMYTMYFLTFIYLCNCKLISFFCKIMEKAIERQCWRKKKLNLTKGTVVSRTCPSINRKSLNLQVYSPLNSFNLKYIIYICFRGQSCILFSSLKIIIINVVSKQVYLSHTCSRLSTMFISRTQTFKDIFQDTFLHSSRRYSRRYFYIVLGDIPGYIST